MKIHIHRNPNPLTPNHWANSQVNWSKTNLYGTPDEIYEKLLKYIDLGVENFMLWFIDSPSTYGMEIFSKEIISKYK